MKATGAHLRIQPIWKNSELAWDSAESNVVKYTCVTAHLEWRTFMTCLWSPKPFSFSFFDWAKLMLAEMALLPKAKKIIKLTINFYILNSRDNKYAYSLEQNDQFWATLARSRITWEKPFQTTCNSSFEEGRIEWFPGTST